MRVLNNDEQKVMDYLTANNRKERNEVFYKGIQGCTGFSRGKISAILNQLSEAEFIKLYIVTDERNPIYNKTLYSVVPQKTEQVITPSAQTTIDELLGNEIYAAVDDSDAVVHWDRFCRWLMNNQYKKDYLGLIMARLRNYNTLMDRYVYFNPQNDEDILNCILSEAESNARKNAQYIATGEYQCKYQKKVTKKTAIEVLHKAFQKTAEIDIMPALECLPAFTNVTKNHFMDEVNEYVSAVSE